MNIRTSQIHSAMVKAMPYQIRDINSQIINKIKLSISILYKIRIKITKSIINNLPESNTSKSTSNARVILRRMTMVRIVTPASAHITLHRRMQIKEIKNMKLKLQIAICSNNQVNSCLNTRNNAMGTQVKAQVTDITNLYIHILRCKLVVKQKFMMSQK